MLPHEPEEGEASVDGVGIHRAGRADHGLVLVVPDERALVALLDDHIAAAADVDRLAVVRVPWHLQRSHSDGPAVVRLDGLADVVDLVGLFRVDDPQPPHVLDVPEHSVERPLHRDDAARWFGVSLEVLVEGLDHSVQVLMAPVGVAVGCDSLVGIHEDTGVRVPLGVHHHPTLLAAPGSMQVSLHDVAHRPSGECRCGDQL